jgi:demethylmenaquinone methyltransferase/2-methoxy-6-polyprenyl-1,4-benzoquinol methylase
MPDDILRQQIEYYRARAGEYDDWFYRKGRYDKGAELNQRWFDEAAHVMNTLRNLGSVGHVLEFACGTGIWTEQLLTIATHITAMDASAEVIAINREKIRAAGGESKVEYLQTDIFKWQPQQEYDMVAMGFWLSHVPPEKLDGFLATAAKATRAGGRFFMVDSREAEISGAKDSLSSHENGLSTRRLKDGREFKIVKIFYESDDLKTHLDRAGFDAVVEITPNHFIYAHGTKR